MAKRHFAFFAEMRKGCVAYSIRTRRRSFLDRRQGSDDFCQKKNNSTMGDIMARTDTLVGEEGGHKKAVMLAVYGALMAPRTRHK